MKRVSLICLGLLLTADSASAKELSPREIYERVSPAVVMVMGHPVSGRQGSGGTGSIIQADGLVLTNAHVVIEEKTGKPYPRLSVFLKPTRVTGNSRIDLVHGLKAKVIASSSSLDLALLQLEGRVEPLPTIYLGESTRITIGDQVLAIGHPEQGGLWSLTTGVISAEVDNFNGVKGKHVYQTETGLNRGNSGGPLIDSQGRMVGVNTAIARVAADGLPITSISFALKSSVAKQWLVEQDTNSLQATSQASDPSVGTTSDVTQGQPSLSPYWSKQNGTGLNTPSRKSDRTGPPMRAYPYDLDQLVSDRAKAEADLEKMIREMRGRVREQ